MGDFYILVCKKEDIYIVLGEGNREKLSSIKELIKQSYSNVELICVDKKEYEESRNSVQALNKMIESHLRKG